MIIQPHQTPNQSQTIHQLSLGSEKNNRNRKNFINRVDWNRFLPNITLYHRINTALSAHLSSLRKTPSANTPIDLTQLKTQVATAVTENIKSTSVDEKHEKKPKRIASAEEMADAFMQSSVDQKLYTLLNYLISKSKNPIPSLELKKVIEQGLFGATKKQHTQEQLEKSLADLLKNNADLIEKHSHLNIAFTLKKKLGLTQEESLPSKQLNYSEEEISVADSSKSADTAFYSAESTEVPNAGSGMPTFIRHRRDANGFGYI